MCANTVILNLGDRCPLDTKLLVCICETFRYSLAALISIMEGLEGLAHNKGRYLNLVAHCIDSQKIESIVHI